MPNSVLLLDFQQGHIRAELKWPLAEFQLAIPQKAIDTNSATLIRREGAWLDRYLMEHMRVTTASGTPWKMQIIEKHLDKTQRDATGEFKELVFELDLIPPADSDTRHLVIHYTAIMHQVMSHKMYVSIRQDWDGGLSHEDSAGADLGILSVDPRDNSVPPIIINLDKGSKWKGFKSMVTLGIGHIADGTDHLLFLLVLLLPAPLLVSGGKWRESGGTRYSIVRLLKIVTAFTIGHSITLLAGAVGWIHFPSQPIEILIAVSILIGAIHALRPLFPGKEPAIAAGFGLIHGLAFATTLANLHLDGGRMALSILGFNIGIELMQLFVVLITVPWLIILSEYKTYRWVRIIGAVCTAIAAISWIVERSSGKPNMISTRLSWLATDGNYLVLCLAMLAGIHVLLLKRFKAAGNPATSNPIADTRA